MNLFVNPFSSSDDFSELEGDIYTKNFSKKAKPGNMILNLGPQHPSTHGVLRIILELHGEYIARSEPILGYLHRMHEKMAEVKTAAQFMPNMGRLDYLHALAWNWAYAGAVERLAGLEVPKRAEYIRVITTEINRISSHLVWWGAFLLDLGAFTPILYSFEDREKLCDILQIVTGSRLTMSYFKFGGVSADLDERFIRLIKEFIPYMRERLKMYNDLVTGNIILRRRIEEIGKFSVDMCKRYGATGPVLRGSGVPYDIRKTEPYSVYDQIDFEIPTSDLTCSMGRYLVRVKEIEISLSIIEQALEQLPQGDFLMKKAPKANWKVPAGESYFAVEGSKGLIGVHLISDGGANPYRIKLRSPSFSNLSLYAEATQGVMIADAIAILGSLDLVIPELDR